jgi:serine/threonine-protein kinase
VLPVTGLNGPFGVAVDGSGTLYDTDALNNRVLKLASGVSTHEPPRLVRN